MVLRREVLRQRDDGDYPEPDGDIVKVLDQRRDRLLVLTRVSEDDEDDAEDETTPPFDPAEHSVSGLREKLRDGDYSNEELSALLGAEEDGKERTTAVSAIQNERGY